MNPPKRRSEANTPAQSSKSKLLVTMMSGGTMARTGLRMMPTFPSSSLRFRTAGFPQYGSKAGVSEGA
ncbi:MAG: hypothetical protein ACLQDV_08550, partial [Candidatus Binataceae bacterium]